jgi:hypothetical protein
MRWSVASLRISARKHATRRGNEFRMLQNPRIS